MNLAGKTLPTDHVRLAILLLAAGEGSRLGGIPKALLKKNGTTLLRSFIETAQEMNPIEIGIVTGFHAEAIEEEIKTMDAWHLPIQVIRNANPQDGQSSSVRLGLEALKSDYDALLVALSDQPNIQAAELQSLLEQFMHREANQEVVLPKVNGQRGNPVLFSKTAVKAILSVPGMVCRSYVDQNPESVKIYHTNNLAYILDVDTEADLQKLGISR